MPLPVFTRTNPASTEHQGHTSRLLLTREDSPSPSTRPEDSDSPLPTLSDEAAIGITIGIVGIVVVLLTIWYLRHRSKKRREGATRRSGVEKWDPVEGPAAPRGRSWVDLDVERQAEARPVPPRFEMNRQAHAGRVWGAPKWNAVAARMAQHEEALREASAGGRRGGRLSKPPPAVTRRPTGEEVRQRDVAVKGEPYVAMLWAPGQGGTLR